MCARAVLLILSATPCAPFYLPLSTQSESRLHAVANRAIKQKKQTIALLVLRSAAEHGGSPRSFLLLALAEQHFGRAPGSRLVSPAAVERARSALSAGLRQGRDDASLLQASCGQRFAR